MITKSRSASCANGVGRRKSPEKIAANEPKISAIKASAKIAQSKKSRSKSAVDKLVSNAKAPETRSGSFTDEPWYRTAWSRFSVSQNRAIDRNEMPAHLLSKIAPSRGN